MKRSPARRAVSDAALATRALARGAALAASSAEVIGARMAMGALLPTTAEAGAEAARMLPEKLDAFARGGLAAAPGGARLAGTLWSLAFAEAGHAGRAFTAMALAANPLAALAAQQAYIAGLAGRMASGSALLSAQMLRGSMAAAAPVLRAASGNARRLRRDRAG